ncbi:lipase [Trypanosoma theileri]|uniref:Lipase n=1 Tax=Trypanosoma theileri TaxID=67003 RepID=A0A1X0P001_9TRYP|nr:lipase [Trypanosoma theileri]ORC90252.1 lipase [Trypanosoma theileri]
MFSVSRSRLAPSALLFLLLLLCSCGVHAAYSETLAKSALLYSKVTYCYVPQIGNWSCIACEKPPKLKVVKLFTNTTYGTLAYMGVDEKERVVISFRGSLNIINWLADLDMWPVPYQKPSCWGCIVHRGFYNSFLSLRDEMWKELLKLITESPNRSLKVLITGHSLGGAMAVLAAADFASQGYPDVMHPPKFELYTFGAPRVGNNAFASWVSALFCRGRHKSYRITNNQDVVPHLPPMFSGFEHTGGEVWYNSDGVDKYRNCSDVKGNVCTLKRVEEDSKCSNRIGMISVMDHMKYMGEHVLCFNETMEAESKQKSMEIPLKVKTMVTEDQEYQKNSTLLKRK